MPIAKGRPQQRTIDIAASSAEALIFGEDLIALSKTFILDRERIDKAAMEVQIRDKLTLDIAVS